MKTSNFLMVLLPEAYGRDEIEVMKEIKVMDEITDSLINITEERK